MLRKLTEADRLDFRNGRAAYAFSCANGLENNKPTGSVEYAVTYRRWTGYSGRNQSKDGDGH